MLDKNYTTVSSPNCADGWLGIMIGDALWYPLWEQSHLETTANEISKALKSSSSNAVSMVFVICICYFQYNIVNFIITNHHISCRCPQFHHLQLNL